MAMVSRKAFHNLNPEADWLQKQKTTSGSILFSQEQDSKVGTGLRHLLEVRGYKLQSAIHNKVASTETLFCSSQPSLI